MDNSQSINHENIIEKALLGAFIIDNRLIDTLDVTLKKDHFISTPNGIIFERIMKLRNEYSDVNELILYENLKGHDSFVNVNVQEYLEDIINSVINITAASSYARQIINAYTKRTINNILRNKLSELSSNDVNVESSLDNLEKDLHQVSYFNTNTSAFTPLHSDLSELYTKLLAMKESGDTMSGISTGLHDLDDVIGGLNPTELIIIAGRPGMGKTALAMSLAHNVASASSEDPIKGNPVGIISLEMSGEQLAMRMLATKSGISIHKMRTMSISNNEMNCIPDVINQFESIPIFIDDSSYNTVSTIRSKARRLQSDKGIKLLIIDYLQLITSDIDYHGNRVLEVSRMTVALKALARELNIPIIVLSQLNRSVESRSENKTPRLSDLRESGSIEQDADVVCFVYRESYYLETNKPKIKEGQTSDDFAISLQKWEKAKKDAEGKSSIVVAKNRHGPTKEVEVYYNAEQAFFSNLSK